MSDEGKTCLRTVGDIWRLCDEAGLPRWPAVGPAGDRLSEFGRALARLLDAHRTEVADLRRELERVDALRTETERVAAELDAEVERLRRLVGTNGAACAVHAYADACRAVVREIDGSPLSGLPEPSGEDAKRVYRWHEWAVSCLRGALRAEVERLTRERDMAREAVLSEVAEAAAGMITNGHELRKWLPDEGRMRVLAGLIVDEARQCLAMDEAWERRLLERFGATLLDSTGDDDG